MKVAIHPSRSNRGGGEIYRKYVRREEAKGGFKQS